MKKYWPLVVVLLFSILSSVALFYANLPKPFFYLMVNFSGFFFLFLSVFKFWDLKGFSEGFQKYDLLAQKSKFYSYLYPFLELFISLAFFARFCLVATAFFTAVLMVFSGIGVLNAVFKRKELKCACMGTKLDLPLTTVSLVENLGMSVMAILIAMKFL